MNAMLRRIAILGLILAVLACSGGAWATVRRATSAFIAPGAADVRVSEVRPGQRVITYLMPNPADGWQSAITRRLLLSGWSLTTDFYQWGDTEKYTPVYQRTSQIWFIRVRERAELLGDRKFAIIHIKYDISYR